LILGVKAIAKKQEKRGEEINVRFYSLLFLWAIGITGCQPVRSVDSSTTSIATEPLSPTPIRIHLDTLPSRLGV
jgi:hypothetical protein